MEIIGLQVASCGTQVAQLRSQFVAHPMYVACDLQPMTYQEQLKLVKSGERKLSILPLIPPWNSLTDFSFSR